VHRDVQADVHRLAGDGDVVAAVGERLVELGMVGADRDRSRVRVGEVLELETGGGKGLRTCDQRQARGGVVVEFVMLCLPVVRGRVELPRGHPPCRRRTAEEDVELWDSTGTLVAQSRHRGRPHALSGPRTAARTRSRPTHCSTGQWRLAIFAGQCSFAAVGTAWGHSNRSRGAFMRSYRIVAGVAGVVAVLAAPPLAHASSRPDGALGSGLGQLVQAAGKPSAKLAPGGPRINPDRLAIRDRAGRVLVDVTPRAGTSASAYRSQLEGLGMVVTAVDAAHNTFEGFLPLDRAPAVAALGATGTIALSPKPTTNIGAATSQGVALQRIDRVQRHGLTGKGITIGALSDSYDAAVTTIPGDPLTVHAADDVRTGDLPGKGNPQNPNPVQVLEDITPEEGATDEGRAILQIAHDVAPDAKLCFATAFAGEIGFANNIRALADRKGPCKADVIVDDVGYFDEPFFSDGILADAIDDVAAQGVHYFSSAGNSGEEQGWRTPVRLLPAQQATRGTNLDFSQVDPALYDGGLQDMDPGPGTDVAQDVRLGPDGGLINVQWDDPLDLDGATLGPPLFHAEGALTTPSSAPSFTYNAQPGDVGTTVQFKTDAVPSGTVDLILSVTAPDGTDLATIDTGSSPEILATTLDQAGPYTITITGFNGDTGPFTVDVLPVLAPSKVTTDFNLLIFDADGSYLGAVADLNPLSGKPQELVGLDGPGDLQLVISRAGTGPVGATTIGDILNGDLYFTEYADPLAPAIEGHPTAKGATAVGAYDPFRPFLPEFFTSPGGDLPIKFDSAGNRYARPQVRRKPEVSAADGGNTTFFVTDNSRDPDTQPNFFGTSASAPHAAAIAALLLQRSGGPRSLSPSALRERLQRSTFVHDLDPAHSEGSASGLRISADGFQGYEQDAYPGPMADPRFFKVSYNGSSPLRSLTLYGETASPTALGTRHPPLSDGIVFDPRPFAPDAETGSYRGAGFPFTVGGTSGGLAHGSVSSSLSVRVGSGQFRHMTLNFARGLARGQNVSFGIDRDLAVSGYGGANEGNGADELGGAVFLPQRLPLPFGLAFTAVRADGRRIAGTIANRLGTGFTPVDGYGVIDAERLVLGD
jgi:hypothetical protein